MRKYFGILASILALGLLSACAALPSINDNRLGPEVTVGGEAETLYYSPSGPSQSANQEQIMSGFIYAGNGPQEDYSVAREYLTPSFSSRWKPAGETLIQTGATKIISNTGTKIRIEVNFDAKVAEDGTYVSTPGSSRVIEFRLLQVSGKWRIADAPNLTILLRPNFGLLFQAVSVYFWDKSFSSLVPEVRWFPTKAAIATRVTNALIAGPSAWLAPAVQNLFPKGTKLNINSVTVNAGNAEIDLNANALRIPSWKRPYLKSQLLASLSDAANVLSVSISIERTPQLISNGSTGFGDSPSNLPVILNVDGLFHVAGVNTFAINGTDLPVKNMKPSSFAISSDEDFLALLAGDSVHSFSLGLIGTNNSVADSRYDLVPPTLDQFDQIWTASYSRGAEIRVIEKNGNRVALRNPIGPGARIRAIVMSSDGARLAILHDPYNGSTVDIVSVVRDKNRIATGFGEPYQMNQFGNKTQAISWSDRITLSAVVTGSGGLQSTLSALVGGGSTSGRTTQNAVSLVSSIGGSSYYLDANGTLFSSRPFGWEKSLQKVLALRLAGQ